GLFGSALQPNFRVRAYMQMGAGVLMILMAANMFGLLGKRSFVIAPPASFTRLLRRSARSESTFTPVVVGFLTVLVPCGVTLSVEFLIIANGSALTGAAAMGAFVLGTTPLFAAIGYAVRRAGAVLGGHLTKLAAVAVAVAGALSINSGLVLSGSGVTLQKVAPGVAAAVPEVLGGGKAATEGLSGQALNSSQPTPMAKVGADGIQVVDISVSYGDPEGGGAPFSPAIIQARSGLPTRLTFHAAGGLGCAGVVVLPRKGIEKSLRPGETSVDLGVLTGGDIGYSCGTGMYGGVIKVIDG
ncbi:MAG: sulfite exporter TauE/SafE family protein, partial [Acidimicrobiales bacterium]